MAKNLLYLILFLIPAFETAIAQENHLLKPIECVFQVRKNLPEWTFRLVLEEGKEGGSGDKKVKEIGIFTKDKSKKIQDLPKSHLTAIPYRPELYDLTIYQDNLNCGFKDVNFDGYIDVRVFTGCDTHANCTDSYWLFNPKNKEFVHNAEISEILNARPDEREHIIVSNIGAGLYELTKKYYWKGGSLILFYEEERNPDTKWLYSHQTQKSALIIRTVRERRKNKMVLVKQERILTKYK